MGRTSAIVAMLALAGTAPHFWPSLAEAAVQSRRAPPGLRRPSRCWARSAMAAPTATPTPSPVPTPPSLVSNCEVRVRADGVLKWLRVDPSFCQP